MSENPVVFFDITLGGSPKGRIEMELRADVVPKTAEVRGRCGGCFFLQKCDRAAAVCAYIPRGGLLTLLLAPFSTELSVPLHW